jgi:GT2 family glycosyltransferase
MALSEEVSIATAAYGNAKATAVCLDAILSSASGSYELILVDDCSPDNGETRALFEATRARHANTKIFCFTQNLEYSGSVNAVLSHAVGRWVIFISNDIFVTPSYLHALLEVARSDSNLGILRGSSNFVDNGLVSHNIQPSRPIGSLADLNEFSLRQLTANGHAWEADPFLVGDAFLVSRAVIDRIGTYDPRFYGYFADPDYGVRARIAGFRLALVRGAFAYHMRDANFSWLPKEQAQQKLARRWGRVHENWARFKGKYDLPLTTDYPGVNSIPWAELASRSLDMGRDYSPPGDYSRFLV